MKHQPTSTPRPALQFLPNGLLALALGVSALAQDPSSTLWYDKPAEKWDMEALPIGNGRLGAMVFGQVGSERIGLNEETMWSGSKFENDRPDAAQNLPEIRRLLSEGKNKEAEALVDKTFTCAGVGSGRGRGAKVPFGCYQELGDLMLHFPQTQETPAAYRRSLDLANAIAAVSYQLAGVTYTREAFTSAVDQVIAVRLGADKPGSISTSIELKRVECFETTADGTLGELLMQGTLDSGQQGVEGLRYACRLRAIPKGGKLTVEGNRLRVEGADELLLLVSAATNYQGFCSRKTSDPAAATTAELSAAAKKPYERLRADHIAEHRGFYDRMSLSLGDGIKESQTNAALPTDQRLTAYAAGG
ncbi:MAG TPA: glycoside hydrolase family 95 protein, partial [Luteolibacter sp.]|nr:glycoside hydrolase family 95 protein [Luteolibacter sp.]